jgi:hypothetical protein
MTDFARTWQEDAQAPVFYMQRAYQFRIAGTQWDGSTYGWVNEGGNWYMAKWMGYQYEMQQTGGCLRKRLRRSPVFRSFHSLGTGSP